MARYRARLRKFDKDTEQQLLEAAGQVFGEKGFDRSTGKEISERAGTNTAAVNYYFGGLENLYNAVLEEAHRRSFSFDSLAVAVAAETEPTAKLRAITTVLVRAATGPLSTSWVLRVLGREMVAPSTVREPRRGETDSVTKLRLVREVIAEFVGLPEDHPAIASGFICFVSPLLVLLIGDRPTMRRKFPGLGLAATDTDLLIDAMHCYALAGLSALANKVRKSGSTFVSPNNIATVENTETTRRQIDALIVTDGPKKRRKPGKTPQPG